MDKEVKQEFEALTYNEVRGRDGFPVAMPDMWYAAPDWIRLTCKPGENPAAIQRAYEHVALTSAAWAGEDVRVREPWGFHGYRGSRVGPAAWGTGHEGMILDVSGPAAEIVRKYNPPFDNVARLDIAVTLFYSDDKHRTAINVARKSDSARRIVSHRPWKIRYIDGFGGGDTTYIGSRSSEKYLRCYDKYREQEEDEEWRYSWRFEAELKKSFGTQYWEGPKGSMPDAAYWAACALPIWADRGIKLPALLQGSLVAPARVPKPKTTNEKRLRWMARSVAPSVRRLLRSGIPLAQVAKALSGSEEPATMIALGYLLENSQKKGATYAQEGESRWP